MQLLSNDFAFNVRCNFGSTFCIVDTVARKNLIGWCKQRDFFSRRLGARFVSISKPFYQHSGTIYIYIGDRSRIWLLWSLLTQRRKITVRYGSNLHWQPVFCHSDRWPCCDMHVDRKRPHLTADLSRKTRVVLLKPYQLTSWILVIIYQQSFIVQADRGSGTLSNPTTNPHML